MDTDKKFEWTGFFLSPSGEPVPARTNPHPSVLIRIPLRLHFLLIRIRSV